MKTIYTLAVLLAIFATAFAAVSQGIYKDPKHPGKCAIRHDLILSPGTHRNPDTCGRIICSAGGHAEFQTCGLFVPPIGCNLGGQKNPAANYPDCCDKEIVC